MIRPSNPHGECGEIDLPVLKDLKGVQACKVLAASQDSQAILDQRQKARTSSGLQIVVIHR
jgi:hypothetical protein